MKKTIFSLLILLLGVTACATGSDKHNSDTYNTMVEVSSRVYLAKWDTKGIGEPLPNGTLRLNPKDFDTDKVVITRVLKSKEVKEVYFKDKDSMSSRTWIYESEGGEEKTLNHQFKNTYMISQLITGKDGGSLKELFEIPE